jgi:hypothetical protein
VDRASYRKFETRVARPLALYLFVQFLVALAAAVWLLRSQNQLPLAWLAGLSALVVWALVSIGALFEGRRWARANEGLRVLALAAAAVGYLL